MEIRLWYCVNGSGQAKVFVTKPERYEKRRCWVGELNAAVLRFIDWLEVECGYELPDISWKDEPVPIDMKIENVYERE
jgi:hypothetical protein